MTNGVGIGGAVRTPLPQGKKKPKDTTLHAPNKGRMVYTVTVETETEKHIIPHVMDAGESPVKLSQLAKKRAKINWQDVTGVSVKSEFK